MNKKELLKELAKEEAGYKKELEINPLSQYSTTQLKKELQRRKREGEK